MSAPEPRDAFGRTMTEHLMCNRWHTVDNFYPADQSLPTSIELRRKREEFDHRFGTGPS